MPPPAPVPAPAAPAASPLPAPAAEPGTGLTRREALRRAALAGVALAAIPVLDACSGGSTASPSGTSSAATPAAGATLAMSAVARVTPSPEGLQPTTTALTSFAEAFVGAVLSAPGASTGGGNVVCSPFSIAAALGMTVNGAKGRTQQEMLAVLGGLPLDTLNAGLSLHTSLLASRAGTRTKLDGNPAEISLDIANSLWGQQGVPWETAFLDALAAWYGAGMRLVDYQTNPDAARTAINTWTSDHTNGRITDLVPAGALTSLTRLVLVNAIYLKAPWEEPFEATLTTPAPFTPDSGAARSVPTMLHSFENAWAASGSDWLAVTLPYAGRELGMTLVLPPARTAGEQGAWVRAGGLGRVLAAIKPHPSVTVAMPKWTFRTNQQLKPILAALGMPTPFTDAADFSAMTTAEELQIDEVLHEAFVAVDEQGTEAAAATAVVMRRMSAPAEVVNLVLDRPFLFVIHDLTARAPLFVGRVGEPSS